MITRCRHNIVICGGPSYKIFKQQRNNRDQPLILFLIFDKKIRPILIQLSVLSSKKLFFINFFISTHLFIDEINDSQVQETVPVLTTMSLSKTQALSGSSAIRKPDTSHNCVTQLNKIRFSWQIRDFLDYFKMVDEHQSFTLISEKFRINLPRDEKTFFHLELTVLGCFMSVTLQHNDCSQCYRLKPGLCRLSFTNSKNVNLITNEYKFKCPSVGAKLTMNLPIQLSQRKDLFPDNSLIVTCEIKSMSFQTLIKRYFVPKECQLMQNDYKALLESSNDSDVIFEINGEELKAHKVILKARSPVFAAMFDHDMEEKKTNRVTITDISAETFKLLLRFIYTDEIEAELDVDTGVKLLYAASKYQLVGLQNLCENKLIQLMTPSNYEQIRMVAETYNLTDFIKMVDGCMKPYL